MVWWMIPQKKCAHKKRACFKKTGHKDNNSDGWHKGGLVCKYMLSKEMTRSQILRKDTVFRLQKSFRQMNFRIRIGLSSDRRLSSRSPGGFIGSGRGTAYIPLHSKQGYLTRSLPASTAFLSISSSGPGCAFICRLLRKKEQNLMHM